MTKRFGVEGPGALSRSGTARITFHEGPLELSWFHCGATAEFLGDFFGDLAGEADLDANEARHSINYLANELLENAVKFRAVGAGEIRIEASLEGDSFEMLLSNYAASETTGRFEALLEEIVSRDPGDLLIERIEANAAGDNAGGSGLGILTLMNDYGVKLGWAFEQEATGAPVRVETYAALTLS